MNRLSKAVSSCAIVFTFAISTGAPTDAAVDSYLIEHNGTTYEYQLNALNNSFIADKVNGEIDGYDNTIFKDFIQKTNNGGTLFAFHDDVTNRYIDYTAIEEAFIEAKILKQSFSVDNYVMSPTSKKKEGLGKVKEVKYENGQLIKVEKDLSTSEEVPEEDAPYIVCIGGDECLNR